MIEINELSISFGKKEVLKKINCTLQCGIYGLLGPNGAGKTTLFRCISGIYNNYSGGISINKNTDFINIGYLPQNFRVFPELNVLNNLRYLAALKKISIEKRDEEIERVLYFVNMYDEKEKLGENLSGGMLRRVGIAQALMGNPEVLLLDEPTVGLDPEERIRFKEIIKKIDIENTVTLMSTHIVEDVEACCKSVVVMNEGEIRFIGNSEELRQQAEGKVFIVDGKEVFTELGTYIIRENEVAGKVKQRILSSKNISSSTIESTLEDGYLCVIKGI